MHAQARRAVIGYVVGICYHEPARELAPRTLELPLNVKKEGKAASDLACDQPTERSFRSPAYVTLTVLHDPHPHHICQPRINIDPPQPTPSNNSPYKTEQNLPPPYQAQNKLQQPQTPYISKNIPHNEERRARVKESCYEYKL